MPIAASPYTSVPNGISTPAQSPDRMAALMALQNLFGASPGGMSGGSQPGQPGPGMPPELAAMMASMGGGAQGASPAPGPTAPQGGAPSPGMQPGGGPYNVAAPQPGPGMDPMNLESTEPDLFQRVVFMLMDPNTKQLNPSLVLLFAGMGLGNALEKTGKFSSKPHRSNQELAGMGIDTGMQGQTGVPNPNQLAQKAESGSGGMPGF